MIYFDASYLVRLYYSDRGFEEVRHLASTDNLACAQHGQAEVIAAFYRKYREGSLTFTVYRSVLRQFADGEDAVRECQDQRFLPVLLLFLFAGSPIRCVRLRQGRPEEIDPS